MADARLLIAHRAGNGPAALRAAERAEVDVIEADLQLRRGRVELRHLRSVGELPLYWDRWAVAPPWRRFGDLDGLLAGAHPRSALMLDLKGDDPALPRMVTAALARHPREATVFVAARAWGLLDEIDPAQARRIGSAARPRQLAGLLEHVATRPLDGASLHLRLLERERLRPLRMHAPLLMTWPVNHRAQVAPATALGVDGLISDNLELLAELRRERGLREAPGGAQGVAQGERAERDQQGEQADGDVHQRDAQL